MRERKSKEIKLEMCCLGAKLYRDNPFASQPTLTGQQLLVALPLILLVLNVT